ncbi:hypothetical protein TARUN_1373 [Trichoderma arundinaceum]|uniref:Lipid droplet-associated hydrolase n=1 Tax=Trichoderma arundinaceum TaxID=490622 RepID=A0A395NXL1_TRIAR|nr:hypothetical protein TARUN_1373 [Trichoderma arundinaceum]
MSSVLSLLAKPRQRGVEPYQRHGLIYFICGNPGLVNYYVVFLDCLRGMLDAADEGSGGTAYDIYGRNLLGFSDDDHEPFSESNEPWDLDGQINGIYQDVAARSVIPDDAGAEGEQGKGARPYDFVILMGHSVGAYISVEIFHRHMRDPSRAPHLNLRHGFLLFPTLTHIANSPSGRRLTILRSIPRVDDNAHHLAKFVLGCIPYACVLWIVTNIMGFTPQTAEVTTRWLKSRDGVWQAIHLGLSELQTICEEKWEEELWETTEEDDNDSNSYSYYHKGGKAVANGEPQDGPDTTQQQIPKFFIFYGKHDHWVANHLRDAFIEKRGERGHTRIQIDGGDIPHAFCVKERELV